jgi:diguanylate cyclase (GGDEF)-like protein/PAS domain S-box-containing protein
VNGNMPGHNAAASDTAAAVLRAVFEGSRDGVVVLDGNGHILACNPSFCRLWNFPPGLLESRDTRAMRLHTAEQLVDAQAYLGSLDELHAAHAPRVFDQVPLRDGRVFERHVAPLGRLDGVPGSEGGIVVRWRDVTARAQAEQALAQAMAEQRRLAQRKTELVTLLDLALSSAELAFWDVNLLTGEVNTSNDRWYALLGYEAADFADPVDGWDALVHPEDRDRRLLAWEAHISGSAERYECEFRMRHKEGHWVWLQARGQAVARGPDGRATRLVGTRQDITVRKRAEQWLQTLAHTDELTGIHNRRRFLELADAELARAQRYGHSMALLVIDLDLFKTINDRHGHEGGDEVLRAFVQTARTVMRQSDVFGRIGGEEFTALLPYAGAEGATAIAERLLQQTLAAPCRLRNGQTVAYSVSIGVAVVPPGAPDASVRALMQAADRALYDAKAQGRARVVLAAP